MTIHDAWQNLDRHAARLRATSLRALFGADDTRFERFSWRLGDLLVDFSREKLDAKALEALLALARAAQVEKLRDAMFAGEPINLTENRAVLHMAARDPKTRWPGPHADEIAPTLARFLEFAEEIRNGGIRAPGGKPYTDVISIGIGGSDLGPQMAAKALSHWHDGPRLHFVSNVDGTHLADVTRVLDAATTLVIVQSKTFTTQETMTNACSARAWLEAHLGPDAARAQLAAVSTNLEATKDFGIPDERVFGFWDWIGGRYSLWSAIGLPLAIAIGAVDFRAFLDGARAMDTHFRDAPLHENIPVLMGLVGIWRRNAMATHSVAVIPYDERLSRLPAYLQQLAMESNGKRVTRAGHALTHSTCPVIWGEPGTNAQHSFFQLLHQGTDTIPVDFILAAQADPMLEAHHNKLMANCLAQSQALAFGKTAEEVRADMQAEGAAPAEIERLVPHRTFPGDRPSSTIIYKRLTPFALGRLIALYEHKVFVEAAIWDINAFDQWGVELGKALAKKLLPLLGEDTSAENEDSATRGLIGALKEMTP